MKSLWDRLINCIYGIILDFLKTIWSVGIIEWFEVEETFKDHLRNVGFTWCKMTGPDNCKICWLHAECKCSFL